WIGTCEEGVRTLRRIQALQHSRANHLFVKGGIFGFGAITPMDVIRLAKICYFLNPSEQRRIRSRIRFHGYHRSIPPKCEWRHYTTPYSCTPASFLGIHAAVKPAALKGFFRAHP